MDGQMYWRRGHHTLQQRLQQPRLSSKRIVVLRGLVRPPEPGQVGDDHAGAVTDHGCDIPPCDRRLRNAVHGDDGWAGTYGRGGVHTEHADPVDDVPGAAEVVRGRPGCSHDWQLLCTFFDDITVKHRCSERNRQHRLLGQPAAPCPTALTAAWACRACSASAWVGLRSNTTSFTVPVNA